ncbi:MAG: prepilin peptidase [Vallitaleaceae bacterium]|jgi:leader peptidase (prepilin peptidase)/N-methyltransferase|nr:prepilin peptidase [Vallitaleaceae bacterium]
MLNIITFSILGLLVGSFLNVCIYRIPRKEEIVITPSHCMTCGHTLRWYELFPVISYIAIKGKCYKCKTHISIQYPIIELLNGAAYMGLYLLYGISIELAIYAALFSILLIVFMIDLKTLTIPNSLVIAIGILGLVNLVFNIVNWPQYIIGFFSVSALLFLIAIITKGKMGGGDIKLMAVAGLLLGWQRIILSLLLGSVLGAVIGLTLIGLRVVNKKALIPFGPYLAVGIMVSAIWGQVIIDWYIGWIIG